MTDDLPTLAELSTSMGWTRRRPYRATPEAAMKLLDLLRQRAGMPAIRDALFPMANVKDARRYAIDVADNDMFGDALTSINGDVARQAALSLWDMWRIDQKQPHAARMQSLRSLIKLLDDIELFARRFAR